MTRTVFLNLFYGLLYHLTKKQPPLSASQIMGAVLIVFLRGYYINIDPKGQCELIFHESLEFNLVNSIISKYVLGMHF